MRTTQLAAAVAAAALLGATLAGALPAPASAVTVRSGAPDRSAAAGPDPDPDPDPVIVVAGTGNDQGLAELTYAPLTNRLVEPEGRRAFVFGLPGGGLGDVEPTAEALATRVDEVLDATDADRVDL